MFIYKRPAVICFFSILEIEGYYNNAIGIMLYIINNRHQYSRYLWYTISLYGIYIHIALDIFDVNQWTLYKNETRN